MRSIGIADVPAVLQRAPKPAHGSEDSHTEAYSRLGDQKASQAESAQHPGLAEASGRSPQEPSRAIRCTFCMQITCCDTQTEAEYVKQGLCFCRHLRS